MIEEIIINIQHELSESLSENQMKQLLASLRRHLSALNAQAAIDSESQMSNWLPLFVSAKRVEGCSEKSLRYYESAIRNMPRQLPAGRNGQQDDSRYCETDSLVLFLLA